MMLRDRISGGGILRKLLDGRLPEKIKRVKHGLDLRECCYLRCSRPAGH